MKPSKTLKDLVYIATVAAVFLFAFSNVSAQQRVSVSWVKGSDDSVSKIGKFFVKQYKNAGTGGKDWVIFGSGYQGGDGEGQLWLFDSPSRAIVNFSVKSSAIAFLLRGDHNDGHAKLIIDDNVIGEFDLYRIGNRTLVVTGLPYDYHTIQVVHIEKKNPRASDDHVAIFGGAALTDTDPTRSVMMGIEKLVSFGNGRDPFNGQWREFKNGKSKWLIRREGEKVIALYISPREIGRAEGTLANNELILNYKNTYQNHKKYFAEKGARDAGKIVCKGFRFDFTCKVSEGKMNHGLEFLLERQN